MRALPSLLVAAAALALIAGPVAAQSPAASPAASAAPVASAAPATPAPSFGAAWQSVSCDELDINEKAAAIADCGYVTVKENRAKGTDSTIQLGVVRLHSNSATPGVPVVIGTGGPGGAGLDFINKENFAAGFDWTAKWAPILADRDVVRFTQRGTQLAKPFLACPEYDAIDHERAINGWSRTETDARIEAALTVCRDRFVAEGVDLSAYNTDENAADIVDIKDALGYDKIAYYGESYGTLLGQFLLRNHPEVLESIILDGIAPTTPTLYSQMVDLPGAFQRLFDGCKAQPTCAENYGTLEKSVKQLIAKVDKDPVKTTVKAADGTDQSLTITSKNVLDYLFGKLYGGGSELPQNVTGMLKDLTPYLADIVPHPGSGAFARIQHFAINCADDPNASMKQFKLKRAPGFLRDFMYDDGVREVIACKVLGVPQLPATSDELVTSDLPALLLNGGLDPATAFTNGHVVEEGLPNSQYVLFPAGGHVQSQDPCAISIIAAFLKDPTAKVDTACIKPAGQFVALAPVTVKNADGSASLGMKLALPTWVDQGDGNWVFQGIIQLNVSVLPPTTTPDQAVKDALKQLTVVEDSQIKDGDKLAGLPSRTASVDVDVNGTTISGDAWAFSTPKATYVITLAAPGIGEAARKLYPQILTTITVDPAS